MQKTLISIIGSTGIGKTKLAIEMAKHFGTEIISCDSRQFFKEMKIGTATPTDEELAQAKHHFIGHLSVQDYYSIGQYEEDALEKIEEIFEKNDFAVLVGGSMMYEKAVVEGLNDLPEANAENQKNLQRILDEEGLEKLQDILKNLDEEYYNVVHKENPRRLLRAIDVIWQTGRKYSEIIAEPKHKRDFKVMRIGVTAPREIMYERINLRVDKMLENGLIDEVKSLTEYQKLVPLQTVGYSEIFKYLEGNWDLDFAIEEIKKNSRRYAKRQETWNRKVENVTWLPYDYSEEQLHEILSKIEK
ncbi:MAG: tRNA (adenosine(37)-N6)-dimethylallyltransferase MiaA [Cloacibacterium sp.]|nr:tRNA (adenosine(37)-N6)-dimethylallyltransferase MiaA [Cloacibacterium sp.]